MAKKKKLRVDRIFICFFTLIFIFLIIYFGNYSLRNLKIYNKVKSENVITVNKKKLRIWKKTIQYVKDNKNEITIKYKKNFVTIPSSEFENKIDISLDLENRKINKPLFNNIKVLYVKDNYILKKSNKVKIKLPIYLYKNNYVDVYGVKSNGDLEKIVSNKKVSNKHISFDLSNEYKEYFIAYIKIKDYSVNQEINLKKGEEKNINITFNPSNATNQDVKYKIEDKDIISIENDTIKALENGTTSITVTSNEIVKTIKIIVSNDEEVIKEDNTSNKKYEITTKNGITYVDGIMIVNKTYSLPNDYNPGLSKEYTDAFDKMKAAAKLDNIEIFIASGFRSYQDQEKLYNAYVKEDGKEKADTYSARPGYSEHQSGLAADINTAASWFDDTSEAKWLEENCYKYGFIIRYPKGEEKYTGYKYESWHLRYVGEEIAKKIHDAGGISLEHYYDLKSEYQD